MSKIIFLGSPAYGHVNPTLPVVQELAQRGEQVIYYNTDEFRTLIESTGATFHAYPPMGLTAATISEALHDGDLSNITGLVLRAAESLVPFFVDEFKREQPDLVIFDSLALWGKMATTLVGVRDAASISHCIADVRAIMSEDEHSLSYLRHLLPKLPGLLWARFRLSRRYPGALPKSPVIPLRGGLNILYGVRELQPDTPLIDKTFRFVGPSINPQVRPDDFPLEALQEGTLVYISLGTVHQRQGEFFRQCFAAFADYPAQFVVSVGKQTDMSALGKIPPNFIVRPSVPQLDILQRADAFITHGGLNSVHEGLYYGVPLIVIPHQIEQLLNARRIEAHGAGIIITKQLSSEPVQAADLRPALEQILSDGHYRESAAKLQAILRASGGYRQAADEIQAYLA